MCATPARAVAGLGTPGGLPVHGRLRGHGADNHPPLWRRAGEPDRACARSDLETRSDPERGHRGITTARPWIPGVAAAAIGLGAAACSGGSSGTAASGAATSKAATSKAAAPAAPSHSPAAAGQPGGAATVSLHTISATPEAVLVGSGGRTLYLFELYLFEADKGGTSACPGACAAAWPPDAVTGTPKAGSGVNQALLGTIKRPDGTMQVTCNGHPLYYVYGDAGAGTARGQGPKAFGAGWYVVSASGAEADTD